MPMKNPHPRTSGLENRDLCSKLRKIKLATAHHLQSLNSAVKILSLATAAANSFGALPYSKVIL